MGEVFRDMQFLLAQQQHFMSKPVRPNNQPLTLTQVHKKITSFIIIRKAWLIFQLFIIYMVTENSLVSCLWKHIPYCTPEVTERPPTPFPLDEMY